MACAFCDMAREELFVSEFALGFADAHPVSAGHTLVIPRRHVASLYELSDEEYQGLWGAVRTVRNILQGELRPAGFNIGVNDGAAAGQTVFHAHVHVIPRYAGDSSDPRGGVRWILPERAPYWDK